MMDKNIRTSYDFTTLVSRDNIGNMKAMALPEEIRRQGIVSFGGAEMDFPTAPSVIRAITDRAAGGLLGYTVADESYLKPIVWWMEHVRETQIAPDWIVPTLGTIYSVATAIRLFCRPGEAILTMPPVYYRYEQAATRLGRRTLHCPLIERDDAFYMDFDKMERLMAGNDCRLVVLCNPQNPVGRVWTREELEQLAGLSAKYRIPVFSDEIFAETTFDGKRTVPYMSIPRGRDLAITATSLGKTFNFTGVNQANLIIPDEALRNAFIKQRTADHFGSIDPLFHAAIGGAYCEEGASWLAALREHLDGNRRRLMQAFAEGIAPGKVYPIEGTFVAWIRWDLAGRSDDALIGYLRRQALLDVEPGYEYGEDCGHCTRMNFATTAEQLDGALERIHQLT